jgi:peroxiredoxin family protein
MMETVTAQQQQMQDLVARVEALEKSSGANRLALGVMSGNLDTTIAAFIIALGATAYDMEVDMFFTFWATAALRDPHKAPRKGFLDRMFGRMLPRSSRTLPLSKMQMAGVGPRMIRSVMKQRGVKSLEQLMKEAAELGVRIHVCEMSMGVMGLKREEMISYPGLDFVGVGTFINMVQEARQVIFL